MSFHIPLVLCLVHLNTWIIAPCALYLATCEANQRKSNHKRLWWNKDCKIILWTNYSEKPPFSSISSFQSLSHVWDSLQLHGLQHAKPPCPSPTPGVYSNSCPLSRWCHPIFPIIRVFSNESALCIRWPKDWSFSFGISPSNEYSGLISFRMDWLDLLAVQGILKVFSNTTVQKHKVFGTQLSL